MMRKSARDRVQIQILWHDGKSLALFRRKRYPGYRNTITSRLEFVSLVTLYCQSLTQNKTAQSHFYATREHRSRNDLHVNFARGVAPLHPALFSFQSQRFWPAAKPRWASQLIENCFASSQSSRQLLARWRVAASKMQVSWGWHECPNQPSFLYSSLWDVLLFRSL